MHLIFIIFLTLVNLAFKQSRFTVSLILALYGIAIISFCPSCSGGAPLPDYLNYKGNVEPETKLLFQSEPEKSKFYRIPVLVFDKDTIFVFCERRNTSQYDNGDIDIIMSRSFDYGRNWEAEKVIVDIGGEAAGNPTPVFNRISGDLILVYCRNNDRVFVTRSKNKGDIWEDPVEITEDVKLSDWGWYATGPVHGIQLQNDRLLIPCDHKTGNFFYSHVIYSDNGGVSWHLGGIMDEPSNECTLVELVDGSVYLNMRGFDLTCQRERTFAISYDSGQTFTKPQVVPEHIEPVCQASIIRYTRENSHDRNRILFSNPNHDFERMNMSVQISYDEAQTWLFKKTIFPGPSGYSDMAVLGDMSIGMVYENGEETILERITFARFTLEWLTDGMDSLE